MSLPVLAIQAPPLNEYPVKHTWQKLAELVWQFWQLETWHATGPERPVNVELLYISTITFLQWRVMCIIASQLTAESTVCSTACTDEHFRQYAKYHNTWWRHQMEAFSAHWPVTRSLNKRLSKQSRRRWLETPSHSLWHYCNTRDSRRCVDAMVCTTCRSIHF